jgi:hypothetical protein
MDALTRGDVLDFNNPDAPAACRLDGVYAKAAITNEPRHHELSHRFPSFVGHAKGHTADAKSLPQAQKRP